MTNKCSNCYFWRDKAWVEDSGIGICDNEKVIKQVTILNEDNIQNFLSGSEKDKKLNAKFIINSMRFSSEFCCTHYKILEKKWQE